MNAVRKVTLGLGLVAMLAAGTTWAQAALEQVGFLPDNLKWSPGPPMMPPGLKVTVLEGNPEKAGPFTMRGLMPAGYKIMPHFHARDEKITVLQGSFFFAMGDKWDEKKGKEFPAGGYVIARGGMHHYAWAGDETIIQISGEGPFNITYLNPKDDPMNGKKPKTK